MIKYIIYFFPLICIGQNKGFQLYNITENLKFIKLVELKKKTVSAFDVGNIFLAFTSDDNLNIYDHINNRWYRKDLNIITNTEISIASSNQLQKLTKKDIRCVQIDNKRGKIGFTMKFGLFKEYLIKNINNKECLLVFPANEISGFKYSKINDAYNIFYKFYPDSMSMEGSFRGFTKRYSKQGSWYQDNKVGIEMPKILTIDFNASETIYGGIRNDSSLWLWNKTIPNELNVFKMDTLKLKSFSFIHNDSIAMQYNHFILLSTIKNYQYKKKVAFNSTEQPLLSSFIYNQQQSFFVGQADTELILFKLINGQFEIFDKIKVEGKIKEYKVSENGKILAVLIE